MNWRPPEKPPFEEHMVRMGPAVQDTPWERMEYSARRTGRTYRMIEKALEMHARGFCVYILVHSSDYGRDLRKTYNLPSMINIETPRTLDPDNVDWVNMRPSRNAWPKSKLFVDHYFIELQYLAIMREYHAYDYQEKE